MRRISLGLFVAALALMTIHPVRADVAAPAAQPAQPWAGVLAIDTVKSLPHTTRAQIPSVGTLYWGVIADDKVESAIWSSPRSAPHATSHTPPTR